ncbi:hypothetical protein ACFUTV_38795 [Streptomyces sp. NPDC057298]|uniref:hypothetical protein n=1 Tax=Streptomyces sp. NPDC057298 TaxID=3346091 RepID=UPI00363E833B
MNESIRFACITSPDQRHACFFAAPAANFGRLLDAWNRDEELTAVPFEFADPQIASEVQAWLSDAATKDDRPPLVLVGSAESGQWVNWNLADVPRPPVPSY